MSLVDLQFADHLGAGLAASLPQAAEANAMAGNSFQQQVLDVAEDLAQSVTAPLLGFLWSWIKRIIPLFIVLVVLLSLGLSAYTFFRQQRDRQLKFSVSSGKNSGADQVDLIEKKLRDDQSFWGPNYLVTEIATGGSLDNLRNVERDQDGNVIGIAVDGLSPDKNDIKDIRTLVPLQWCYLHFVVRNDSLEHVGFSSKELAERGEAAITLTEWAAKYRIARKDPNTTSKKEKWPIRIYLGKANSGTRQIAEQVLKNANIKPAELEPSFYVADAEEIPERLARYHIDGAFVLEPLPSAVVSAIAADERNPCTLISIDNTKVLLPSDNSIVGSKIPAYTYSFTQPLDAEISHLEPVESLATRRLIVTSSKMSDDDAYYLANCVQAALPRDQVSRPDKDNRWHGPDPSDDNKNCPPSYQMHPGVDLSLNQGPGPNWFGRHVSWLGPLLLAMAISLVTEFKNRIPMWLAGHQPPAPPQDGTVKDRKPPPAAPAAGQDQSANGRHDNQPTRYAEIESQLDALYDELMAAYDGDKKPSKAELTAWKERLDILMRYVRPLRHDGKLSRNDVEALYGTASKLQRILELLREPSFADSTVGVGSKQSAGDGRGKGGRRAK